MSFKLTIAFSLLLAAPPLWSQQLRLELPDTTFVLQMDELPLQQREGQVLVSENGIVTELMPLLQQQKSDEVLVVLRTRFDSLISILEAGDPNGEAKQRAIAGGLYAQAKSDSVSATMLYLIGSTYLVLRNHVAAEAAFTAAITAMPDYIRVHESLGIVYLLEKRHAEALSHLSRAVQLGLATPNLYGALGFVNYEMENFFGAASAFQNALMLEPTTTQWQEGLLSSLAASKQQEAGLALVEQLLKSRPDDSNLWVYRSSLELSANRRQSALNSLEIAIRLGNDETANLQVAAALHLEEGSVDRAVDLLSAGMGKGLDFHYVDQGMQSLVGRGQWAPLQKLLDEYQDVAGLDETRQSLLLLRRASVSQHNNDTAQAKTQLQQAITLDPANGEALLLLGQLQHKDKNYAQAELLLQRATADPDVAENAALTLAQVAIDQLDYAKALRLLRDALAASPARSDLARNIEALESLVQLQP